MTSIAVSELPNFRCALPARRTSASRQREITDCAASGGRWYERDDRLAPEVVHHIPQGVKQPAHGDEPIIAEAAVRGEQQCATEEVFAYTEASVEVHPTGASNQDGAEIASVPFLQSRAQPNKGRGHNERRHQMGCRKDPSCVCLHRLTLGPLGQPEKWRDCQLSTDSGHRLSYAPAVKNVVILALEGVLPFDLSTPLEVFGRARLPHGQPAYQVRICAPSRKVDAGALSLQVAWALNIL